MKKEVIYEFDLTEFPFLGLHIFRSNYITLKQEWENPGLEGWCPGGFRCVLG